MKVVLRLNGEAWATLVLATLALILVVLIALIESVE